MRFVVPQFIEREMKIIGPLTLPAFLVVIIFLIVLFILSKILPKLHFFGVATVGALTFLYLYFGKIQGVPVWQVIPKAIFFLFSPKVITLKKTTPIFETFSGIKIKRESKIPLERKPGKVEKKKLKLETRL